MICSDFESIRKAHDHPPKLLASFECPLRMTRIRINSDQRGLQLHAAAEIPADFAEGIVWREKLVPLVD